MAESIITEPTVVITILFQSTLLCRLENLIETAIKTLRIATTIPNILNKIFTLESWFLSSIG